MKEKSVWMSKSKSGKLCARCECILKLDQADEEHPELCTTCAYILKHNKMPITAPISYFRSTSYALESLNNEEMREERRKRVQCAYEGCDKMVAFRKDRTGTMCKMHTTMMRYQNVNRGDKPRKYG